jgi:hypothetical protein
MRQLLTSLAMMATLVVSLPPAWCCMLRPFQSACCSRISAEFDGEPVPADCANCCTSTSTGQKPPKVPTSCLVCQSDHDFLPQARTWEPSPLVFVQILALTSDSSNSFQRLTCENPPHYESRPPLWLIHCCFRC